MTNVESQSAEPRSPRFLLSDADLGEAEAAAVADVVRSKWLSVGERTAAFETAFAEYVGTRNAVATSSATAALHLTLLGLGIGPGDEVLVPSYTFVATANAILYVGATPVFVDIVGSNDLNIDPRDLEAKISPRSRAIMVVHLAGYFADMTAIMEIAERHGLDVIEDAAHAVGVQCEVTGGYKNQAAGTIGVAGCFSFFANKNLVTGEGGMVTTDDDELARKVRLGRSHGMTKTSWDKATGRATDYDIEDIGYNYRPTELTAALGLIQLEKVPAATSHRRLLTERYRTLLASRPDITIPFGGHTAGSAYHIMPIVLPQASMRSSFRAFLDSRGVQTSVHYPPIHMFTHYARTYRDTTLSITEDVAAREVTLPLHSLLSSEDVDEISELAIEAFDASGSSANVQGRL
jgi:dTDP-4-amino-4,6-dideoxygalactose transaminase